MSTTIRIPPARIGLPPTPYATEGLCRSVTANLPHERYDDFARAAREVARENIVKVDTFDGGDVMIARFCGVGPIDSAAEQFQRAISAL